MCRCACIVLDIKAAICPRRERQGWIMVCGLWCSSATMAVSVVKQSAGRKAHAAIESSHPPIKLIV